MNKLILLLSIIIYFNLFALGQIKDTIEIRYSSDSVYKTDTYVKISDSFGIVDSILFKDLKEQKKMVFQDIIPNNWDDCETLSNKLGTNCIVLNVPYVHEVLNFGDSIPVFRTFVCNTHLSY